MLRCALRDEPHRPVVLGVVLPQQLHHFLHVVVLPLLEGRLEGVNDAAQLGRVLRAGRLLGRGEKCLIETYFILHDMIPD